MCTRADRVNGDATVPEKQNGVGGIMPDCLKFTTSQRRRMYMKRFGLEYAHPLRAMPASLIDQLDRCSDDSARRILLGITAPRFQERRDEEQVKARRQ